MRARVCRTAAGVYASATGVELTLKKDCSLKRVRQLPHQNFSIGMLQQTRHGDLQTGTAHLHTPAPNMELRCRLTPGLVYTSPTMHYHHPLSNLSATSCCHRTVHFAESVQPSNLRNQQTSESSAVDDGRLRVVMKSLIFPGSTFTSQFIYINFNTSSTIRLYTDRKD